MFPADEQCLDNCLNIIKTITCSPWTHAALYIGRMDEIKDGNLQNKIAEFYTGDHRRQLFDTIKYPYLSLDEIAAYRLLPWDEEIICNDTGEFYVPADPKIDGESEREPGSSPEQPKE